VSKELKESIEIIKSDWIDIESLEQELSKLRRLKIESEKREDAIEFEYNKSCFKLEQTNRRSSVIDTDLLETENQIKNLWDEGIFPESVWKIPTSPPENFS